MADNKFTYAFLPGFSNNLNLSSPNRYLGGSKKEVHPFIKGYFYVLFEFPGIVKDSISDQTAYANLGDVLLSLCESFTPPGDRQMKTEDVMGMGGLDATFVTGQTIDRTFSLMFRDLWGSPVFVAHRSWTSIINPYFGGLVNSTQAFVPSYYKGRVLVIQTTPKIIQNIKVNSNDINTVDKDQIKKEIVKVNLFEGVVPITDLSSVYDSNITDNTIVRPTIQYRFDGKDFDETYPGVLDLAADKLYNKIATKEIDNALEIAQFE